jgi:hypothetical protein
MFETASSLPSDAPITAMRCFVRRQDHWFADFDEAPEDGVHQNFMVAGTV